MKFFTRGGGVVGGVAARMGRTGFTVCGMRACGMPTATRRSGVAPFLPALTGLADHTKDLVLRHANSLALPALFADKCRWARLGRVTGLRTGRRSPIPDFRQFPACGSFNIGSRPVRTAARSEMVEQIRPAEKPDTAGRGSEIPVRAIPTGRDLQAAVEKADGINSVGRSKRIQRRATGSRILPAQMALIIVPSAHITEPAEITEDHSIMAPPDRDTRLLLRRAITRRLHHATAVAGPPGAHLVPRMEEAGTIRPVADGVDGNIAFPQPLRLT
jgi:hypothetical protein